jgi:hypothetical protein
MFLFKKHLDRRTFLRGMGATVALPLLDAMLPARALLASLRPAQRLTFVYFPHGAVMSEWIHSGNRQPAAGNPSTSLGTGGATGSIQLGRILEPLSPFANRLTIVSGVENKHAYGPVHAITPGTWLSGTNPGSGIRQPATEIRQPATGNRRPTTGLDSDGATADQIAAECLGRDTLLPSISLAAEEPKRIHAGIWEGQFEESYGRTISFRQGRVPVAMQHSPRAVFDTLFQSRVLTEDCSAGAARPASLLDVVADDIARLRSRLGSIDRAALANYLENVRDVERRVHRAETMVLAAEVTPDEIERRFVERMALMFDLTALAFRADITRVASLMMAAETSSMTYSHAGAPESFHALSHHQNDPEKLDQLVRIQAFHTKAFANFVRSLEGLPDGDASILDRARILFGSNMSNSHAHDHFPLPLAMIGGGCGTRHGFRHVQLPDRTPMSNLLLTVLRRSSVPMQSFGGSTGECGEV